ncbi:MAG: UDP-N-acetylglucosamine 2-epimerase (non-hydrolyzing) [Phycisphaerae bacterium]|nr:UDP-N-acetylglucosamine 2-epimerase (non-hydrolyzing) [Phycisphaerae bacterium]
MGGSDRPKRVLCCVGTRPEAIKMAPVLGALRSAPWAECTVLATAQHRGMLDQMLGFFEVEADVDLDAMRENQTLPELMARLLPALDATLATTRPDIVLAQGDTTTVLAVALASFYRKTPFAHVEAGLRTGRIDLPFPEEANRVLAGRLAALHFAPTAQARANLAREGITSGVHVVGNTVIDALLRTAERDPPLPLSLDPSRRLVLVTAHRRDAHGEPIRSICRGVRTIAERHADVEVLWPVHPNPSIRAAVESEMGGVARVRLCEPLDYGSFVAAMKRSTVILTDSGGVQEEAPALGKPVLVMREDSERPEAVRAGVAALVGTDSAAIVRESSRLLTDPAHYARMSRGSSPYGDGRASERIVRHMARFLGVDPAEAGPADEFREGSENAEVRVVAREEVGARGAR